jgi:UDP-N-acetylglucosamine acyltransferase
MAQPYGINKEGLKRRGFSSETIQNLKRAYKTLYRKGLSLEDAVADLKKQVAACPEVQQIVDFLERSKRGIIR